MQPRVRDSRAIHTRPGDQCGHPGGREGHREEQSGHLVVNQSGHQTDRTTNVLDQGDRPEGEATRAEAHEGHQGRESGRLPLGSHDK